MVSGLSTIPKELEVPTRIFEIENIIKQLKWWQFFTKMQMQRKLDSMRFEAAKTGFYIAINTLIEAGVIEEVKQ